MRIQTLLLSLSLALASLILTGCAATTAGDHASAAVSAEAYSVVYQGSQVEVKCSKPMPLGEFLKMAQSVTGRMYTYHKDEASNEISWVGTLSCERTEFEQFVATMLKVNGLAAESRQQGGIDFVEVRSLERS